MASIDFTIDATHAGVEFYAGGSSGASRVVGIESKQTRVARYSFSVPAGATGISFTFNTGGVAGGSAIPLRFYIGTDPTSHTNADASASYTGELTLGADGKNFTGSAEMLLLPNITYYLFVFPNGTTTDHYGYYTWYKGSDCIHTFMLTGGAGIVYVGGVMYQIYVGNSSGGADLRLSYCGRADGGANLLS